MATNLRLRQVEIFKAMMECGTTIATSERLNLSQPTISEHLQSLERATGLRLFDRGRNRLTPTLAADAFYSEISRVYRGVEHLNRFVDGMQNDFVGQIDFGAMPMAAHQWIPGILGKFLEKHPVGAVSMPVRSSRQILEWVAAERLDFGIAFAVTGYPQVKVEELLKIPLVCMGPIDSPLMQKEVVELSDLDGQTIVQMRSFDLWTSSIERIFDRQQQIHPKRTIETYVTQTAAQIAKASGGYALVDQITAMEMSDEDFGWRNFEGEEYFEVHLALPRSKKTSREAEVLIDMIRQDSAVKAASFCS